MSSEEFEDFMESISDQDQKATEEMIREKEKAFSEGCIEGYNLIKEYGTKAIDSTEKKEAEEALNRMIGYFIQIEHYEKCSDIQKIYRKVFKKDPTPIFPNFGA